MKLKLQLFSSLSDIVGKDQIELPFKKGDNCDDLKMTMALLFPGAIEKLKQVSLVVNQKMASWNTLLQDGDEVTFLFPAEKVSHDS